MSSKKKIIVLVLLMLLCCAVLFAEEQVRGNADSSFSLYHRVSVDASLSYRFTNSQGATISNKTLEIGTTNNVGSLYASFNVSRQINLQLVWTPLIRAGESVATEETAYPYTMTLTNQSGSALPSFASPEAGVAAAESEFVVYGDYGAGEAYFINKWLEKTTAQMFQDQIICNMSIVIDTEDNLPPGTYSGSIYFVIPGA